nr:HAMP domain-containing sensor histidine kinase [uncultured Carboxylicivirga sp.]
MKLNQLFSINKNMIYSEECRYEYRKELHQSILRYNKTLIPFMYLVFIFYIIGDYYIWKVPQFAISRLPGIITCTSILIVTISKLRNNIRLVVIVNNIHCIGLLIMGFGLVLIGPNYNFKGIISCILFIIASHFFIKGYKSILLFALAGTILAIPTLIYSILRFSTYHFAEIAGLVTVFIGIIMLSISNENKRFKEFYLQRNLVIEKDKTQEQNHQLNKINKQLDVALTRLAEVDNSKNKFFSIIAHDLRSPFSSVVSLMEELKINLHDYTIDEIETRINIMEESTKSTLAFLNNLLFWASSQLGGIKINKQLYSLESIIEQSIAPYLHAASLKNIKVNVVIHNDIRVLVDKSTMRVVISNLFSNAIKYTSQGGTIRISTELNETTSTIFIEDDGIGMSDEIIKQLFNIDNKISRAGTENERGSGLGLVLSSDFIKYNDGEIKVSSKVNEGSCFSIILPNTSH